VSDISIRDAAAGDSEAIARVAIAAGQDEEWSGSDPAYVRYLLARGRMVVAEHRGAVTGFGATLRIGAGPAAVTMLCDLFVDPRSHGLGLGRAMLAVLWRDGTRRMTFSSLHAHALPLYARAGLDAWWPLLYLGGEVAALAAPPGWAVRPATPGEVAGLEREWTGTDRAADHQAWAGRPGGQPVRAERDGQPVAAGTVAGEGAEYGLVHLALAPGWLNLGLWQGPGSEDAAEDACRRLVTTLASALPAGGVVLDVGERAGGTGAVAGRPALAPPHHRLPAAPCDPAVTATASAPGRPGQPAWLSRNPRVTAANSGELKTL